MVVEFADWQMPGGAPILSMREMGDYLKILGTSSRYGFVLTSGGYDPIHPGHISCIEDASSLGALIVVVNDDGFLERKKGKAFQPQKVRCQIVSMLKSVAYVVPLKPSRLDDDSVCEALEIIRPNIFAKGGDRNIDNIPETKVCSKLGILIVQGMGDEKHWSSSSFLRDWGNFYVDNLRQQVIEYMGGYDG